MSKIILIIFIIITFFPPPIEKIRYNIRIILSLCAIIFVLQNIEGFGTGIDGEALRNIASLYNNADGTLIVKNLTATGNITLDGALNTNEINILRTNGRIQGPTKVGGVNNEKTFIIYGTGHTDFNSINVKGNVHLNGGNLYSTFEGGNGGNIISRYGGSSCTLSSNGVKDKDGAIIINSQNRNISGKDITATGTVNTNNIKAVDNMKPFHITMNLNEKNKLKVLSSWPEGSSLDMHDFGGGIKPHTTPP